MKKIIALLLAVAMTVALAACGTSSSTTTAASGETTTGTTVKMGFICLHDENSTYDLNFINAAKAACEAMNVEYVIKTGIPEGSECLTAAEDLVDQGCNLIFADSFGHEDYLIEAAKKYPDVQFAHATGTKAHTAGLSNFHNAFASIYQGRYLAGVAAGMKLNEMIANGDITEDEAVIGYVGAYTYAEVISGYTAFYLGALSECPSATIKVQFTGSWYDYQMEKEAAQTLIADGCVLISGHADSLGAPEACEEAGVPNISYNGSTEAAGPNTYIISSKIDWQPYFEYLISSVQNGTEIAADWTGDLSTGSVELAELNEDVAAEGTADKLAEVQKALEDGSLKVFDTSKFTVTVTDDSNTSATVDADGHLTSYLADVDTDEAYEHDTEVVIDGEFQESVKRSAPYFDLLIDGVEWLNVAY